MKKRYLLAGLGAVAGGAVAWKLLGRERELAWKKFANVVPFADRSQFIEVDNVQIHYQEFGAKTDPVIFLIHGYIASTFTWNSAAPRLAEKGFRVFVVDLIGFGFSQKPAWSEYTIDSQARMIIRLMDRLGIGRAILIGSSYGGGVAAVAALDYSDRVEKLVLVGAVSNDEIKKAAITRLATLPVVGEVMAPFLAGSKTYAKFRLRNSIDVANHDLIDENRITGIMRPLQTADVHRSLILTLRNWHADRIERDAHNIKQPTLLIWGENDRIIPLRNGQTLHRAISDSRLVVFKNCGHVPHEEYTEDFLKLVTEFASPNNSKFQISN